MYDAIVIGARVAGSPTAMLLARKGFKVLLVDRTSFPSDTLSTHLIQLKGVAALKRWGLLQSVLDSNCPPMSRLAFHQDRFNLQGNYLPLENSDAVICPRRTVLDKILADAAVEAGAELRQDLIVEELLNDAGTVTGIRSRMKDGGKAVADSARLVIGADGKHSLVARAVHAKEYHSHASQTCAYYTYWEGVPLEMGELYTLPGAMAGFWPTNDGQIIIFTGYPVAEFDSIRHDVEGHFWKTMQPIPGMMDKLRSGRRASRFLGTADLPFFYRRPYGSGWALVGDAGMTIDPVTGQGIGHAFRDAERLAEAVEAGFSGRMPMAKAMSMYEQERNAETLPMYEFTRQVASFEPMSLQQEVLFTALENKPKERERFFGMITGSVSVKEFFSARSLFRMLGMRGMGRIILGHKRKPSPAVSVTPAPKFDVDRIL